MTALNGVSILKLMITFRVIFPTEGLESMLEFLKNNTHTSSSKYYNFTDLQVQYSSQDIDLGKGAFYHVHQGLTTIEIAFTQCKFQVRIINP